MNNHSNIAVHVRDLRKSYGLIEAVRGISFDVRRGEIFGLIGPDGAGKTTTFQILAGVMNAGSGDVQIFGESARDARLQTGYLTQTFSLYPDLSVMENIRYVGDLRLVPPAQIEERGHRYLRMFQMDQFSDRLAGNLSGGMKQKLALACALVPEPHVLLLDEPTTGVDPVSRREFWDALAHLSAEGLTILIATPYLDEAERCNRIAFMHLGEIRQIGTPDELRHSLNAQRIELYTSDVVAADTALSMARGETAVDVQRFGDRLDVLVRDAEEGTRIVEQTIAQAHLTVDQVRVDEPTLENIFVAALRQSGETAQSSPFPYRHDHRNLRGRVAIAAEHLIKRFGPFVAVNNVNLEIRYGEIYGLLGANGAGKTTTIKILCGLLDPTSGSTQLAGASGNLRSRSVREDVGYMSQKFSLYNDLTINENLDFFAAVYGVPPEERLEKMRWVLDFAGLQGKRSAMVGALPGGWKQRVAFGSAIMHEPSVVFLDEPTSGVDPLARRAFWRMINELADAGAAVLVTTHYLEEAEQCNRVGFMVAGELIVQGSPSEIKARQPGHLLEMRVDKPQQALDVLQTEEESWRVSLFGDRLHVIVDEDVQTGLRNTIERLGQNGINVIDAHEARFSLEDVFISEVERAREQGKVAAGA